MSRYSPLAHGSTRKMRSAFTMIERWMRKNPKSPRRRSSSATVSRMRSSILPEVQNRIIALGLQPVHFMRIDELHAVASSHHQAPRPLRHLAKRVQQPLNAIVGSTKCVPRAVQRLEKALVGERFEQIVHRADVERAHRISVVCRDHDDRIRQLVLRECRKDVEAVHAAHLDVEKKQVRPQLANGTQCRLTRIAFRRDVHVAHLREQRMNSAASRLFIVDNDCANLIQHRH